MWRVVDRVVGGPATDRLRRVPMNDVKTLFAIFADGHVFTRAGIYTRKKSTKYASPYRKHAKINLYYRLRVIVKILDGMKKKKCLYEFDEKYRNFVIFYE